MYYFTDNVGPIAENEKKSLKKALDIYTANENELDGIIILIHTKNNTSYIERIFGKEIIDKLFAGCVYKGVNYRLVTKK